jgi:hypothetical protein
LGNFFEIRVVEELGKIRVSEAGWAPRQGSVYKIQLKHVVQNQLTKTLFILKYDKLDNN